MKNSNDISRYLMRSCVEFGFDGVNDVLLPLLGNQLKLCFGSAFIGGGKSCNLKPII